MNILQVLSEKINVKYILKKNKINLFSKVFNLSKDAIEKEAEQYKLVRYYFSTVPILLESNEEDFSTLVLNKIKSQALHNAEEVKKEIASGKISKELQQKLEKICFQANLSIEELIKELELSKLSPIIFGILMINPSRQNIPEKEALEFLKEKNSTIKKLPSSGKGALFVNGYGELTNIRPPEVKSIDFYLEKGNKKYYVSHKFTEQAGGSQDSQLKEIYNFLTYASRNNNPENIFVALLDGNYYKNKFSSIREKYSFSNILILNSNEFKKLI